MTRAWKSLNQTNLPIPNKVWCIPKKWWWISCQVDPEPIVINGVIYFGATISRVISIQLPQLFSTICKGPHFTLLITIVTGPTLWRKVLYPIQWRKFGFFDFFHSRKISIKTHGSHHRSINILALFWFLSTAFIRRYVSLRGSTKSWDFSLNMFKWFYAKLW